MESSEKLPNSKVPSSTANFESQATNHDSRSAARTSSDLSSNDDSRLTSHEIAISVRNLSKKYRLYDSPQHRLKEALHPFRKKYHRDFMALKDVSFDILKGACIGIIGRNGSGKSTLLQILCGVLQPTDGEVIVRGNISALLELGAGFNPEFTGRQNVYMNGALFGFTREEVDARFQEIADFADIGAFMEQPVKTYSSGMNVRLAFAAAVSIVPDILIVDEALSVGDIFFQQKCHQRMEELLKNDTTIIMVSHDMRAIEKYCTRVMVLDHGCCLFQGQPNEAVQRYYDQMARKEHGSLSSGDTSSHKQASQSLLGKALTDVLPDWPSEAAFLDLSGAVVIGADDVARCTGFAICNEHGAACHAFQVGQFAHFYFEIQLLQDIDVPIGGISLINQFNVVIHSKGTLHYLAKAPRKAQKGDRIRFKQSMKLQIAPGEYSIVLLFSTMPPEDYELAGELSGAQLHSKIKSILRVTNVAKILVRERSHGLSVPFYGYVDLEGDSKCELLHDVTTN